eukprot:SAG11_NODE_12173_length_717_cov_2.351133_1_plen_59_part_10
MKTRDGGGPELAAPAEPHLLRCAAFAAALDRRRRAAATLVHLLHQPARPPGVRRRAGRA